MIHFSNVDYWYFKGKPIFNNLNLELETGKIYGLLGKNGAGKTTLLRLISGLLFPKAGEANVMGFDPSKRHPNMLADLFFISEDMEIPKMGIQQFVEHYSPFYPRFDRTIFDKILSEFEIEGDLKMNNLSYGQKKKVMLSFGLASNTRLLVLDEPTNGLDIPSKTQFRKVLSEAATEGRTIIISTHQVRDLANLMEYVIILKNGRIFFQNDLESISKRLNFKLIQSLTPPEEVLYSEPVPGGFLTITPNVNGEFTEVEVESLFNAIISHKSEILNIFKTN